MVHFAHIMSRANNSYILIFNFTFGHIELEIGAFHLVHTHLGGDEVKSPIHFYCVLHAKGGGEGSK